MTIRPIVLNGMIQRTDDVGTIKHQEEQKQSIDQQNIQVQVKKEEYQSMNQVQKSEDSEMSEENYDAKEESKEKYKRNTGKRIVKKNSEKPGDCVVRKNARPGFDMKI